MAFVEVTPCVSGNVKEKMLIQVNHIMSIAPVSNHFTNMHTCKILVPGMMFEVEESYEQVKAAVLLG